MTWDNVWVRFAVVLIGAIGSVALITRIGIWLVYCFKAAPNRSGAEEMDLADKAEKERDLQAGKAPYTSYEQWRKDILSDKPISEIVGRVPEGFFEKKPEPPKGVSGTSGAGTGGPYGLPGFSGYVGIGPQGPVHLPYPSAKVAQDAQIARQRLEEIRARMAMEEDKTVKDRMALVRSHIAGALPSLAPFYSPANVKAYCQHCNGSGYMTVTNLTGIPTSGVPCAWCRKS